MSTYKIQATSVEASQFSGSFIGDGSGLTGVGGSTPTGSLLTTASVSLNTITFTKGDSSTFNITVDTGSVGNIVRIATGSITASVTPTQFSVTSGSSTELLVTGTGVTIGNVITDAHRITGSLNISGSITATSFSIPTSSMYGSNLPYVAYRLPAAVTFPTSSTTILDLVLISTASLVEGQMVLVQGFVSLAASSSNRTLTAFWNDGPNGQTATYANTATNGHFGFMARVTSAGVRFPRTTMYSATNQSVAAYAFVSSSCKIQLQAVNLASSFILEHATVTIQ